MVNGAVFMMQVKYRAGPFWANIVQNSQNSIAFPIKNDYHLR
jgi:hypothetical protein